MLAGRQGCPGRLGIWKEADILLTDLDRELERRQLTFCRYADDCNVYVRSRVAGERVMGGIRAFLEEVLHLQINAAKSAVARPWERKFLGFSFTAHRESRLQLVQNKQALEDLDGWVRRRLRCLLWRQWRRPGTRARKLRAQGLDADRARVSAGNGRKPPPLP